MTKGGAFTLFFVLLVAFVILLVVTLSMHSGTPSCTGNPLNCPSGGGAAQDADGVARGITAIGTFLAGIAAMGALIHAIRKDSKDSSSKAGGS